MKAWYIRTFGVPGVPRWVLMGAAVAGIAFSFIAVRGFAFPMFVLYTIVYSIIAIFDDEFGFHTYVGLIGVVSFLFLPFSVAAVYNMNPFSAWIVSFAALVAALIVPVGMEAPAISEK